MLSGVQTQGLFEPTHKTEPVANQERADIQNSLLKLLFGKNGIGDGLEMPLERLVTPRFGVHELGSQPFDLMQNFLPSRVQRPTKSRIHDMKGGSDGVQTGSDLFTHPVEDFHALNARYRFSA